MRRTTHPSSAEVQISATTLGRIAGLDRLLGETNGEDDHSTLLTFWTAVEFMVVRFSGT